MKKPGLFKKKPSKASHAQPRRKSAGGCITAAELANLPLDEQGGYRPVDPKYERLPLICKVLYGLAAFCLLLYTIMNSSVAFADWFNRTVSAGIRTILAALTAWIPFSVGELVIWMLPLLLYLVLRHAIRRRCDTWRTAAVYVGILLSVVVTLFSFFVLTFAAGYRAYPLEDKLELEREKVSAEELYDTAVILIEAINRETSEIEFYEDDFSIMPYPLRDMNHRLGDAYSAFCKSHDFIAHSPGRVKPVLVSEVMSYMHITGVYSFFTGEANLNVGFPDYIFYEVVEKGPFHRRND